ncbi:signal recognition particle-docking protein FtsY [Sandaracinus amylolyticus]|uniref:Signal recognition particle receptor FtsY n=1 Tax=Sandaracinus amylolyticus TaxID=927083 RepID=A0A0F6W476_9BACT|nr:signal recognition particle-docking protein FtsY [Sandaracinus amylolyticus]AKF07068.1 Signal recognition particle receptor protein FtsY [Sandaracinus amylolyticus]
MEPGTIVAIVVVAVLIVVAVVFAMRRQAPEAPSGEATPPSPAKPSPEKKAEPAPAKAPEPAKAAPEKKPVKSEPSRPAAEKPIEPKAAEVETPASPKVEAPRAEAPVAKAEVAKAEAAKPAKEKADGKEQVAALRRGLASTRGGFIARLAQIFGGKKEIDPALLDQIQEVLITADIGVRTSEKMLETLRAKMERAELRDEDAVWSAIREEARAILGASAGGIEVRSKPTTILVVGVNGVGKTTTIGKLASRFHEEGKKVVLAAGDTFRAAAVLQLEVWARRVGCEIVKGKDRADPASVIFEAIKKAQGDGADVVIADTAGRLHTKSNLMEELKKVVRTAEKALERPVDEILLVLDSTTGQNAIQQAQLFKDAIPVSGIVLTKLDGTAKGGVVLGIVDEHRIPVRYVGIGERIEDLREFDTDAFVQALFAKPDDETAAA